MAKPLPPPGIAPRRLTPPEKRQASGDVFPVEPDAKTPRKPVELATYQALLSAFDDLTAEQRTFLVEFAFLVKGTTPEDRTQLLDLAIEMNGLA